MTEIRRYPGGAIPFGYVLDDGRLVEDAFQQSAIKRMRKLHDYGISFRDIARTMAEDGFNVSHMTISRILHRTEGEE